MRHKKCIQSSDYDRSRTLLKVHRSNCVRFNVPPWRLDAAKKWITPGRFRKRGADVSLIDPWLEFVSRLQETNSPENVCPLVEFVSGNDSSCWKCSFEHDSYNPCYILIRGKNIHGETDNLLGLSRHGSR
jgi:hypothetical protein